MVEDGEKEGGARVVSGLKEGWRKEGFYMVVDGGGRKEVQRMFVQE